MQVFKKPLRLSKPAQTTATKIESAVKIQRKEPKKAGGKYCHLTDEQALGYLRRCFFNGESIKAIADEAGISITIVRSWYDGNCRSHLRRQVERELEFKAKELIKSTKG